MKETAQQPPRRTGQRILAVTAVICAAVAIGFAARYAIETERGGDVAPPVPESTYSISVPDDWRSGGAVTPPEGIKGPEQAVEEALSVPGYDTEDVSEVQSFVGDDGELYWVIETQRGTVTVKAIR